MKVTTAQLRQFAPPAKSALIDAIVNNWSYAESVGQINTPLRVMNFFAQVATETGGLTSVEESLYYTTAVHIRATWPTRFPTLASAQPYVRNPEQLAIKVYGGRMGNAPAPSTDGWDFRGGGMLQDTGRDNYRANGYEDNPQALREPVTAFKDAVDWWAKNGCNAYADRDDIRGLRIHINGGTIGLDVCQNYRRRATNVWGAAASARASIAAIPQQSTPTGIQPAPIAAAPAFELTPDVVASVQARLKVLGYSETGTTDGTLDDFTETAILAFRKDNGLPLTPTIDAALIASLASASPREVSVQRANATGGDVRAQVPEVKASFFAKGMAMILGIPSVVGSALTGVFNNIGPAKDMLAPVQEFLGDVPMWAWFTIVAGAALGIYLASRHAEVKGTEAFQSGARR